MELMKKAKSKEFWQKVREDKAYQFLVDELKEGYEKLCRTEIAALKYSDYKVYFETGSREEYQAPYYNRRMRMNILALLSLIYPENNEYLSGLEDVLWAIMDEYCWALPAHVSDNITNDNIFIDLFAAETGFAVSEISYFLDDRLAPLIKSRIRAEVDRRIIDAYIERQDFYFWDTACDNNWAAVCAGAVGGTFLYMRPELFESVKPRIDADMERFLSGFYADGACREGLSYWTYGFGFYVFYNDLLKQYSDGRYDCFKEKTIKTIALFQQKCYLQEDATISFADGPMRSNYNIGLTFYLKSVYDEIEILPLKYSYTLDHCARWFMHARSFICFDPEYIKEQPETENVYYMKESGWISKKSKRLAFAAKGGDNDESHNHNDIGQFIVVAGGRQVLCDLGAGEYTRQYFTASERYKIFCNAARGHSVPMFDGIMQKEGKGFYGITSYENGIFKVDMTKAYDLPKLTLLERSFELNADSIIMTDKIELTQVSDITERIITLIKPRLCDGIVKVDELNLIYDKNAWHVEINTEEHITHHREKVTAYCIDFRRTDDHAVFSLKMEL